MGIKDLIKIPIVKHFVISITLLFIFLWFLSSYLSSYTNGYNIIKVPDLKGLNLEQVKKITDTYNLKYLVIDSIHNSKLQANTVIMQDPYPNTEVKENRTLYLTMVCAQKEKTKMPNLINLSLRQAGSLLDISGLEIGNIQYRLSELDGFKGTSIIKQMYKNKEIAEGKELEKGSKINIWVEVSKDIIDSTSSDIHIIEDEQ